MIARAEARVGCPQILPPRPKRPPQNRPPQFFFFFFFFHVHDVMGQPHLVHESRGDDGKRLVSLPQIDVIFLPTQPVQQFFCAAGTGARRETAPVPAQWLAWPRICARTVSPWAPGRGFTKASTKAAAPSEIEDASPPSPCRLRGRQGFELGDLFGTRGLRGCSSAETVTEPWRRFQSSAGGSPVEGTGYFAPPSAARQGGQRIVILHGSG